MLFSFLAALPLAACAPPSEPQRLRYLWPPAADLAKVEYINFYNTEEDLKRGVADWFGENILGKEVPSRLFSRPFDVASNGQGQVYVTDVTQKRVLVLDFDEHELRSLRNAKNQTVFMASPNGVTVDEGGNIFVSDAGQAQIYRFGPDEIIRETWKLDDRARPTGLVADSRAERLYVADPGRHLVEILDYRGRTVRTLGARGEGEGAFNFPLDVDLDPDGNLYVLDSLNARVQVFGPDGNFLRQFGERGTALGSFRIPKALGVSPSGQVYVTDAVANRMVVFDLEGNYLITIGGSSVMVGYEVVPGGFYLPQGIDVDQNDTIWVVDSLNRLVHEFQYLTPAYLEEHPLLPGQNYLPPGFERSSRKQGGGL